MTATKPDGTTHTKRADLILSTTTAPIALDITVTSALNSSAMHGNQAATLPGTAARIAEHNKRTAYNPIVVTPLVMEAHGRWGEDAVQFLASILKHANPADSSRLRFKALRILSTTLQKENANTINDYRRAHSMT